MRQVLLQLLGCRGRSRLALLLHHLKHQEQTEQMLENSRL
jgi:hypothetical protein